MREASSSAGNTCKATSSLRKGGDDDADGSGNAVLSASRALVAKARCMCLGGEP